MLNSMAVKPACLPGTLHLSPLGEFKVNKGDYHISMEAFKADCSGPQPEYPGTIDCPFKVITTEGLPKDIAVVVTVSGSGWPGVKCEVNPY